ncbi:MAG: MFS transporter [Desulfobacula sp.]|jgi:glycoside/pentoside/hexuronide:cation symporter, GPH family|nr:MFS transporter [Desulfobacula sp.]MBT7260817.1 MFS transporter [Desulfobacula sp.]
MPDSNSKERSILKNGIMKKSVKLSLGTILLYNLAGFAFNLYDTILYAWLPYFYTPPESAHAVQYVSLGLFGFILAAGRILDAFTDPFVGYMSDRTHSRWGRRKPFIFVSGPLLFIFFVLAWRPPVEGTSIVNAVYLGLVLFFYYWAYTGFLIPWLATLPELSQKNDQRIKVVSVGIVLGTLGAIVGGGLSGMLIDTYSPFVMALILGSFAFVAGGLSLYGVKENYIPPKEATDKKGFIKTFKEVFKDKQVLSFCGMIMFVQLTYQLMLMNVPYMTTLVLGQPKSAASVLMGEVILLMALSIPLWYFLLNKYPKRSVMRFIIGLMALGFCLSFFIGRINIFSPYIQAIIILPIAAIPMGGMFTASLGLISDLTDYGELKKGTRTEAIYFGIYGIVRKTGWAFCSIILTTTFSIFGYSPENSFGVSVIWIICALSCIMGFILFIPYKLGDTMEETKILIKK